MNIIIDEVVSIIKKKIRFMTRFSEKQLNEIMTLDLIESLRIDSFQMEKALKSVRIDGPVEGTLCQLSAQEQLKLNKSLEMLPQFQVALKNNHALWRGLVWGPLGKKKAFRLYMENRIIDSKGVTLDVITRSTFTYCGLIQQIQFYFHLPDFVRYISDLKEMQSKKHFPTPKFEKRFLGEVLPDHIDQRNPETQITWN